MTQTRSLTLVLALLAMLAGTSLAALSRVSPAYYTGSGWPSLRQMSRISTDSSGDHRSAHLDIVADYFCFSDSKFHAAIQNRGGGFPASGRLGTEYYSYMVVLAQSDDQDYVWAMTYINVPVAGYRPGLYRIDVAEGESLTRIGDISHRIVGDSNLLQMSCNISTLLADPLFKSWYSVSQPRIVMLSQSLRTTVVPFRTRQADGTSPGKELNLQRD